MDDAIFKNTTGGLVLRGKLWTGDEEEGVVGGFHANTHVDVCEAEEDWVGNSVTGHNRNIGFIGGEYCPEESCTLWKHFLEEGG